MADTATAPSFVTTTSKTLQRGASSPPGRATSRLNFSLHETVTRVTTTEKVREARALHDRAYTPDVLGVRGQPWNATVASDPQWGKSSVAASDQRLSCTLLPTHIQPTDFRKTSGPTGSPASSRPAAFDRGTLEWGVSSSTWNTSSQSDLPAEQQRRVQELTASSKQRTAAANAQIRGYVHPEQRQQMVIDRMRDQKKNQGVDYAALVEQWGPEGADHMLHIAQLQQKRAEKDEWVAPVGSRAQGRGVGARRGAGPKAGRRSQAEAEAVRALDEVGEDQEGVL